MKLELTVNNTTVTLGSTIPYNAIAEGVVAQANAAADRAEAAAANADGHRHDELYAPLVHSHPGGGGGSAPIAPFGYAAIGTGLDYETMYDAFIAGKFRLFFPYGTHTEPEYWLYLDVGDSFVKPEWHAPEHDVRILHNIDPCVPIHFLGEDRTESVVNFLGRILLVDSSRIRLSVDGAGDYTDCSYSVTRGSNTVQFSQAVNLTTLAVADLENLWFYTGNSGMDPPGKVTAVDDTAKTVTLSSPWLGRTLTDIGMNDEAGVVIVSFKDMRFENLTYISDNFVQPLFSQGVSEVMSVYKDLVSYAYLPYDYYCSFLIIDNVQKPEGTGSVYPGPGSTLSNCVLTGLEPLAVNSFINCTILADSFGASYFGNTFVGCRFLAATAEQVLGALGSTCSFSGCLDKDDLPIGAVGGGDVSIEYLDVGNESTVTPTKAITFIQTSAQNFTLGNPAIANAMVYLVLYTQETTINSVDDNGFDYQAGYSSTVTLKAPADANMHAYTLLWYNNYWYFAGEYNSKIDRLETANMVTPLVPVKDITVCTNIGSMGVLIEDGKYRGQQVILTTWAVGANPIQIKGANGRSFNAFDGYTGRTDTPDTMYMFPIPAEEGGGDVPQSIALLWDGYWQLIWESHPGTSSIYPEKQLTALRVVEKAVKDEVADFSGIGPTLDFGDARALGIDDGTAAMAMLGSFRRYYGKPQNLSKIQNGKSVVDNLIAVDQFLATVHPETYADKNGNAANLFYVAPATDGAHAIQKAQAETYTDTQLALALPYGLQGIAEAICRPVPYNYVGYYDFSGNFVPAVIDYENTNIMTLVGVIEVGDRKGALQVYTKYKSVIINNKEPFDTSPYISSGIGSEILVGGGGQPTYLVFKDYDTVKYITVHDGNNVPDTATVGTVSGATVANNSHLYKDTSLQSNYYYSYDGLTHELQIFSGLSVVKTFEWPWLDAQPNLEMGCFYSSRVQKHFFVSSVGGVYSIASAWSAPQLMTSIADLSTICGVTISTLCFVDHVDNGYNEDTILICATAYSGSTASYMIALNASNPAYNPQFIKIQSRTDYGLYLNQHFFKRLPVNRYGSTPMTIPNIAGQRFTPSGVYSFVNYASVSGFNGSMLFCFAFVPDRDYIQWLKNSNPEAVLYTMYNVMLFEYQAYSMYPKELYFHRYDGIIYARHDQRYTCYTIKPA